MNTFIRLKSQVAVNKVLEGPNRELTSEFLRVESHFLLIHRFSRVRR